MGDRRAEHRARMKERGYKEVRYWVPDVGSPRFRRRIRIEAQTLDEADRRAGMAEFLEEIQADTTDER